MYLVKWSLCILSISSFATQHAEFFYACRAPGDSTPQSMLWSVAELRLLNDQFAKCGGINACALPIITFKTIQKNAAETVKQCNTLKHTIFEAATLISNTESSIFYCYTKDGIEHPILTPTPIVDFAREKCLRLYATLDVRPYSAKTEKPTKATDIATYVREIFERYAPKTDTVETSRPITPPTTRYRKKILTPTISFHGHDVCEREKELTELEEKQDPLITTYVGLIRRTCASEKIKGKRRFTMIEQWVDAINLQLGKHRDMPIKILNVGGLPPDNHASTHLFT